MMAKYRMGKGPSALENCHADPGRPPPPEARTQTRQACVTTWRAI